jgi:hypothetical protein
MSDPAHPSSGGGMMSSPGQSRGPDRSVFGKPIDSKDLFLAPMHLPRHVDRVYVMERTELASV